MSVEQKQPLISVVLPVYGVEKYLPKCLDSVINQTYNNLDVIIVDDGTKDNSGIIADEYAKKDSRINVIHKKNGGLSDARNVGITQAKGEYITFIDSDDYVELDLVEYLYELIKKNKADLSFCTHNIVRGDKVWKSYDLQKDEVLSAKECITKLLYNDGVDTSAWAKLYKTEMFSDVTYPVGKLFEDIATTYKLFLKANKIASGKRSLYNYMLRDTSIVGSSFNEKKLDLLEMTDAMGRDVLDAYPDLENAVLRRRVYARISTLNQMLALPDVKQRASEILDFISQNTMSLLTDDKVQIRDKVALILLKLNFGLYKYVWLHHGKK